MAVTITELESVHTNIEIFNRCLDNNVSFNKAFMITFNVRASRSYINVFLYNILLTEHNDFVNTFGVRIKNILKKKLETNIK